MTSNLCMGFSDARERHCSLSASRHGANVTSLFNLLPHRPVHCSRLRNRPANSLRFYPVNGWPSSNRRASVVQLTAKEYFRSLSGVRNRRYRSDGRHLLLYLQATDEVRRSCVCFVLGRRVLSSQTHLTPCRPLILMSSTPLHNSLYPTRSNSLQAK